MKKSVNISAAPKDLSLAERLRLVREAGFQGVELNIAEEGEFSIRSDEAAIRKVGDLVRKTGLELASLLAGLCWKYPLTSENPATRRTAVETLERSLRMCAWAGTDALLAVPGVVQADWAEPGIVSYDAAWERSREGLRRLVPVAEETGVVICVENVWNKFILSPLEMKQFVDGFGSPRVGVYFDVGNIIPYGYPEQWIRILGSRIRRIHLKDFRMLGMGVGAFVGLLEGDINWPEVMKALRETRYAGFLTAEYSAYRHHPEALLAHLSTSIDAILSGAG